MQPEGDLWDHTMLVLSTAAARPVVHAGVGRAAARRGQAVHAVVPERPLCLPQPRAGRRRDRRDGSAAGSSSPTPSASGSPGWSKYHQYLGEAKRLREAKLKRILAEPGIEELLALHRADALATRPAMPRRSTTARLPGDQPAGPINPPPLADRPRPRPARAQARVPLFKLLLERVREAQLEGQVHSKSEALEWVERAALGWPREVSPAARCEPAAGGCRSDGPGLE